MYLNSIRKPLRNHWIMADIVQLLDVFNEKEHKLMKYIQFMFIFGENPLNAC